jgi:hypothetical protein
VSSAKKEKYHFKLDFGKDIYQQELLQKSKSNKVICILKSLENIQTYASKKVKTKTGELFTKMYSFITSTFTTVS